MLNKNKLNDFARGKPLVVFDEESRENEGDIVIAGSMLTPEQVNWVTKYARGLVCIAISYNRAKELCLEPMPVKGPSKFQTPFVQSIEAAEGVTTGISAFDRCRTINLASKKIPNRLDFVSPGHIFPCRAASNLLLERKGHTEAAVALCKYANIPECALICEIMADDGNMLNWEGLKKFAIKWKLDLISIQDIIDFQSKI